MGYPHRSPDEMKVDAAITKKKAVIKAAEKELKDLETQKKKLEKERRR